MGFWNSIFGKGGSYFLDDESAKSMGDTEYMKQSKAVRRTFPAGGGGEEFEVTKQVSAMEEQVFDSRKGAGAPAAPAASTPSFSSPSFGGASSFGSASSFGGASSFGSAPAAEPAPAAPAPVAETPAPAAPAPEPTPAAPAQDDSMDMFRNMARGLKR